MPIKSLWKKNEKKLKLPAFRTNSIWEIPCHMKNCVAPLTMSNCVADHCQHHQWGIYLAGLHPLQGLNLIDSMPSGKQQQHLQQQQQVSCWQGPHKFATFPVLHHLSISDLSLINRQRADSLDACDASWLPVNTLREIIIIIDYFDSRFILSNYSSHKTE